MPQNKIIDWKKDNPLAIKAGCVPAIDIGIKSML